MIPAAVSFLIVGGLIGREARDLFQIGEALAGILAGILAATFGGLALAVGWAAAYA